MPATAAFENGPDYVQSLARGLRVLRAFDHDHPSSTLSGVAERAGLSRAVVRRSLLTLQHLGYVSQRGRNFSLTPRVLELGYSYMSSLDITELAQQAMETLSQRADESCSMAMLDGDEIVYVLRVPVRRLMSVALGVGARLPAFAASMGRVMLADLPDEELAEWLRDTSFRAFTPNTLHKPAALKTEILKVRQQGWSLVSQELELGLCSIAVPIRAANGRVVAGLNNSQRYSDRAHEVAMKKMLPALRACQLTIEQAIVRSGWLPLPEKRG